MKKGTYNPLALRCFFQARVVPEMRKPGSVADVQALPVTQRRSVVEVGTIQIKTLSSPLFLPALSVRTVSSSIAYPPRPSWSQQ